jgi:large subunit ribosomal protein LX
MSEFTVTGQWSARDGWQPFEKEIEAENENVAREHVLAEFGSQHGLRRTQVEISEARSASESRTESGGEGVDA